MKKFLILFLLIPIFFLDGHLFTVSPLSIPFGKLNVNLLDVVTLISLLLIILKLVRIHLRVNKVILPLLFLGFLLLVGLLRGIQLFGIEQATNSLRGDLYFFTITLSVVVLGSNEISVSRLIYAWGLLSWLIFGVVLVLWLLLALGFIQNPIWISNGGTMIRVIHASTGLILVQAVILALFIPKENMLIPFQRALPWVLIPTIILLQHRTLWVILLFVLVWYALMNKKAVIFVPLIIVGVILLFYIFLVLPDNSQIGTTLASSASNMQTLMWRLEGWKQLLSKTHYDSFVDYVIGQPFGAGYVRFLYDLSYSVEVSPHNFFVQTFLDIGAIGLLLLAIIYVKTISRLKQQENLLFSRVFIILLISQLLFYLTYAPNYVQGLLLGSAILISRSVRKQAN